MANGEDCPKCGTAIVGNSDKCEDCQTVFWKYIITKRDKLDRKKRLLSDKKRRAGEVCPKCGTTIEKDSSECENCGVIVEKFLMKSDRDLKTEKQLLEDFAEAERERKIRREKEHLLILEEAIAECRKKNDEDVVVAVVEASVVVESELVDDEAMRIVGLEDSSLELEQKPREKRMPLPLSTWKSSRGKKESRKWEQNSTGQHVASLDIDDTRESYQQICERWERERSTPQETDHLPERQNFFQVENFASKALVVLKFGGWGWLVAGVLCFFYSLFREGSLLLGVIAFLQGLFGCILFLVIGDMAEKITRIAEKLDVEKDA